MNQRSDTLLGNALRISQDGTDGDTNHNNPSQIATTLTAICRLQDKMATINNNNSHSQLQYLVAEDDHPLYGLPSIEVLASSHLSSHSCLRREAAFTLTWLPAKMVSMVRNLEFERFYQFNVEAQIRDTIRSHLPREGCYALLNVLCLGFDRVNLNNNPVIHLVVKRNSLDHGIVTSSSAANSIVEDLLAVVKNAQWRDDE